MAEGKLGEQVGAGKAQERRIGKLGQQVGAKKTRAQIEKEAEQRKLREEKIKEQREKAKKELEDFKQKEIRSVSDYQQAYSQLSPVTQRAIKSPSELKAEQKQKIEKVESDLEQAKSALSDVKQKIRKEKSPEAKSRGWEQVRYYESLMRGYREGINKLQQGKILSPKEVDRYASQKAQAVERELREERRDRAETTTETIKYGTYISPTGQGMSVREDYGKELVAKQGGKYSSDLNIYSPKKDTQTPKEKLYGDLGISSFDLSTQEGFEDYVKEKVRESKTEQRARIAEVTPDFGTRGYQQEDLGYDIMAGSTIIGSEEKGFQKVSPKTDNGFLVYRGSEPVGGVREDIKPTKKDIQYTTTGEEIKTYGFGEEGKVIFKSDEFAIDPFAEPTKEQKVRSKSAKIRSEYGLNLDEGLEPFKKKLVSEKTRGRIETQVGKEFDLIPFGDFEFEKPAQRIFGQATTSIFIPETYGGAVIDVATFGVGAAITKGGKVAIKGGRIGYSRLSTRYPSLALKETALGKSVLKTTAGGALGGLYVSSVGSQVLAQPTAKGKSRTFGRELRRGLLFGGGAYAVERAGAKKSVRLLKELETSKSEASIGFEFPVGGKSRMLYRTKKRTPKLEQETFQTFEVLDTGQIVKGKGFTKITEAKSGLEFLPSRSYTFSGKAFKTKGRRFTETSGDFKTILKSEIEKPLEVYRGEARIVTTGKDPFGTSTSFAGITKKGKDFDRFVLADITGAYKKKTGEIPFVDLRTGKTSYKPTYEPFARLRAEPKGVGKVRLLKKDDYGYLQRGLYGETPLRVEGKPQYGRGLFKDLKLENVPSKRTIQISKASESELVKKGGIAGMAVEKESVRLFQPTTTKVKITPSGALKTSKQFKDMKEGTIQKSFVSTAPKTALTTKNILGVKLGTKEKTGTKVKSGFRSLPKIKSASKTGLKGMLGEAMIKKTIKKPIVKTKVRPTIKQKIPARYPFRFKPRPTPTPGIAFPSRRPVRKKPTKKPKTRKTPFIYRKPSLVAIGEGIRSPFKGYAEESGFTIRPILTKPTKKKKKRSKK